jgi:hypothetical protein
VSSHSELETRMSLKLSSVKVSAFDLLEDVNRAKKHFESVAQSQQTLLEAVCNKLECKPDMLLQKIEALLKPPANVRTKK